jgi:hypothetical protein
MERIQENDKVEIIDKNSPHFGKIAVVIRITQPYRAIDSVGKASGTVAKLTLKLEGNGDIEITTFSRSLDSQIKKL